MDSSLPGSSTHGVFQARVLEWVRDDVTDWVKKIIENGYVLMSISNAELSRL